MAILRAKELRETSEKDMNKKLEELRLELSKNRGKIDIGGVVDSPGKIKEVRRTIARILTVKKEMKKQDAGSM